MTAISDFLKDVATKYSTNDAMLVQSMYKSTLVMKLVGAICTSEAQFNVVMEAMAEANAGVCTVAIQACKLSVQDLVAVADEFYTLADAELESEANAPDVEELLQETLRTMVGDEDKPKH